MDYLEILNKSYEEIKFSDCDLSRLGFLADYIFNFTTYDSRFSEEFAKVAVNVCEVITNQTNMMFISHDANYLQFLIMCNMPFFASKIDWGCSIRTAFWRDNIHLSTCGLWEGKTQKCDWIFSKEEWEKFIQAVIEFSRN